MAWKRDTTVRNDLNEEEEDFPSLVSAAQPKIKAKTIWDKAPAVIPTRRPNTTSHIDSQEPISEITEDLAPLKIQNTSPYKPPNLRSQPNAEGVEELLTSSHKKKRHQRFSESQPDKKTKVKPKEKLEVHSAVIVGTSTSLEKSYFRQTEEPDASVIRPEQVLKKSLELILTKWEKKQVDYDYMCDQLKSIRQDITIQRIKNQFSVTVYEIHARLALKHNDLNEFNQCQTQLKVLYDSGIAGSVFEFAAYRILYSLQSAVTSGKYSTLLYAIQGLSKEELSHSYIKHALQTNQSILVNNYQKFFKLYNSCPNLGGYLLTKIVEIMRCQSLRAVVRAYFPKVSTQFVSRVMAFAVENDCRKFLSAHGAHIVPIESEYFVDTKKSNIR